MDYEFSIQDYLRLLKRRIFILIAAFLVILAAGTAFVISLPPIYKSYGTILVESQQIPTELVQSTITSVAQERIRIIQQRVMTRANLLRIIDKYDLYAGQDKGMSATQMVDDFKAKIEIQIDRVKARGRRRGEETAVTFTVTYKDKLPTRALRVTNEFVTLFLEENVRTRTTRASETTQFLTQEALRLEDQLNTMEKAIADFKAQNSRALPEHLNLHFAMLERAKNDSNRVETNIRQSQEDIRMLDLELSSLQTGRTSEGMAQVFSPATELAQLQLQLSELQLSYLDTHPEIQSIKARINTLKGRLDEQSQRKDIAEKIAEAEVRRSDVARQSGLLDPEVKELDAYIAQLQKDLEALPTDDPLADAKGALEIQEARLKYQRQASEQRIEAWSKDRTRLQAEIEDLEARILLTPQVESELLSMQRSYQGALGQFSEVKRKQQDAELAENLEEDQKAERFVLLEPPVMPDQPSEPNRPKLMVMVLAAAFGGALVIAFVRDIMTGTLHSPNQLEHRMNGLRVISIPPILTEEDKRYRRRLIAAAAIAAPILLGAVVVSVHIFYQPIDVLFYKVMSRL